MPTPPGWVERSTADRPGLGWASADGARSDRRPRHRRRAGRARPTRTACRHFLHLRTVRFLGHAGSDAESAYRDPAALRADRARDPILATAKLLVACGEARPDDLISWYLDERSAIRDASPCADDRARADLRRADRRPAGRSTHPSGWRSAARSWCGTLSRRQHAPDPGADHQSHARRSARRIPQLLVFGEDVAVKGGVYGVTRGLQRRHGRPSGLRHRARRAVHPRAGTGQRAERLPAGARDPVPGLPAQRRGPAARRGRHPVVLLAAASTAIRWWCASRPTPTRRGSAATSTTTTRWPCSATSPAW